jgi:hypothetical protein
MSADRLRAQGLYALILAARGSALKASMKPRTGRSLNEPTPDLERLSG